MKTIFYSLKNPIPNKVLLTNSNLKQNPGYSK